MAVSARLSQDRLLGLAVLCLGVVASFLTTATTLLPVVRDVSSVLLVIWCLLVFFYLRGLSNVSTCHLASLLAATELLILIWFSGGVYASSLTWLSVLVVSNYFVVGRVAGFLWLLVYVAVNLLVAYGSQWFGVGPSMGLLIEQGMTSFIDYSFAFVVIMCVLLFFHVQYDHAQKELEARQRELRNTEEELSQTLSAREQFIASVSHELRTPMNAIMGFNSLLQNLIHDQPRASMVLEHTRQSADHLLTVINDILDYNQFKSGELRARFAPTDLHETVRSAYGLLLPKEESSVRYRCDLSPATPQWVNTDKHRLTQVLVNLLGNAIKFTSQGEVVLRVSPLDDDWVEFKVVDSGIGIAQEDQERLFLRFSQANPSIQSRYGGSGLGLTISQRLVHLLGGEMGFSSKLDQGSAFWFKLQLARVETPDVHAPQVLDLNLPGSSSLRFLIVDDHAVNRLVLRQVLLNQWPKAQIAECADGHAALLLLSEQNFDLVFLDMVMPGLNGIETATHYAAMQVAWRPPLIGLTANVNPHDLDNFMQAGLSGLLLKPFDREQLLALVLQLVSTHRQR